MHLQSLRLPRPTLGTKYIYKKTHYLTLWYCSVLSGPLHHVAYSPARLGLPCPAVKEEMHLQENILFDLDLGVKVTHNVAHNPLHHVTYSPAKFEVAIPVYNSLRDPFTRNLRGLCTYKWTDRLSLSYKINIPFFLKKKAGIMTKSRLPSYRFTTPSPL